MIRQIISRISKASSTHIFSSLDFGIMCSLGMSHEPIEQDYMGIAKIKRIVDRCRLGHPFEQWCIAYAATSQWNHVPPPLLSLLRDTFRGWTHSRINEKANKDLRDAQTRDKLAKAQPSPHPPGHRS